MNSAILKQVTEWAESEEQAQRTVVYFEENLRPFLRRGDKVLICFSNARKGSLGWIMEQAVIRCGGVPVIWGPDYRWKTVMQQAFFSHATVMMAPPLIVLGLSKLKKHTGLPLYIRHVVTAGYPCLEWMMDGIVKGLDCSIHGSFGFGETGIVVGFSCGYNRGVHIREDVYGVDVMDTDGTSSGDEVGEMVIWPKENPELRLSAGDQGRLITKACPCGCASARLDDLQPGRDMDADLMELGQRLQSWTSVLDCSVKRGNYGLELEMVVFPGEKLPKLPSSAKQVIRPWDPKHDSPFFYMPTVKNAIFPLEND